jgi:hypothetical protein
MTDIQGGFTEKDLQNLLPYLIQSLPLRSPSSDIQHSSSSSDVTNSLYPIEKGFITFVLEEKAKSLSTLLANIFAQIEHTKSLEAALLSYLDANILKVENHLLQIDFWQNHGLHKDVMPLRAQMQQELFQLEQEKVRTRVQLNNQQLQLSREARSTIKELNEIKIQLKIFAPKNGRPL